MAWWHSPSARRHREIIGYLRLIVDQGKSIMATAAELTAILARVDVATTNVAEDIRRIKDQIVGGLTADEAIALQAQAEAVAVRLEGLDAENPEGEVPPPPEA